jgi:hypothetical protein
MRIFGDAFANRFAIAKIAEGCAAEAGQNSGLRLLIGKPRQPRIEL